MLGVDGRLFTKRVCALIAAALLLMAPTVGAQSTIHEGPAALLGVGSAEVFDYFWPESK